MINIQNAFKKPTDLCPNTNPQQRTIGATQEYLRKHRKQFYEVQRPARLWISNSKIYELHGSKNIWNSKNKACEHLPPKRNLQALDPEKMFQSQASMKLKALKRKHLKPHKSMNRKTKFSHTFEGWRLKVLFWGLTLTKRENKLTDHIFVGEGQQNWWM